MARDLKTPFLISAIFHGVMLFSIGAYLPMGKEMVRDVTPIELLHIQEEKEMPVEPAVKVKPKKPVFIPEKKVQKVEEVKDEVLPVEKKEELEVQEAKIEPPPVERKEEPKTEVKVEPPPPIEDKVVRVEPPPPPLKEEKYVAPIKEEKYVAPRATGYEGVEIKVAEGAIKKQETITTSSHQSNTSNTVNPSNTFATSVPAQAPVQVSSPAPPTTSAPPLKPQEQTGSKYGVDGGTGKSTGDELTLFKTMVRAKIEKAKFYPRWARERGFEGVVGVRFVILPDGKVGDIKVIRPCHCEILNKSACEAIKKAAPFNPRPKELEGKEMAMEIDISFKLE